MRDSQKDRMLSFRPDCTKRTERSTLSCASLQRTNGRDLSTVTKMTARVCGRNQSLTTAIRSWPGRLGLRAGGSGDSSTRLPRARAAPARNGNHFQGCPALSRRRQLGSIVATTSPTLTLSPTAIGSAVTVPTWCATSSFSIFIASTTQTSAPASIASPSATSIRITVP